MSLHVEWMLNQFLQLHLIEKASYLKGFITNCIAEGATKFESHTKVQQFN